ncbi:protein required for normal CLN1 and CLN2 G1 cyclin expression [Coelomomyces lativittatus]|nr:protein required for normal CLN1 and CLN2 G1 cyclin expression [Coelomomyces lativittatus]
MLAYLHAHLAENAIHTSASIPTREYEEARENCRQLYARAIELFKTLHAFRSTDPEECGRFDTNILIMYSRLLESSPLATPETRQMALKLYLSARDLLTRANKPVPAELLNNLGVLYHVAGDHLNSSHFFMDALKVIRGDEKISLEDKDALESTLLYNLGRCYEEVRKDDEAERFYNAVLQRQPLYHDSNLRLGMIEQAKGHLKEAASYFIKVVDQAPDNVEAHILLGILQLTMNQTRSARKNFEKVLHSIDKFDLVSLLLLGNIWLFSVNRENKDKALTEAWKMYEKVLLLDPRNPYAANGIAIALRDRGCLEEALRLFEQVREADDKVPCFMVNYAHILSELGQFKRAIPLYEKAMARFFENKNVDILVSTARAYYQLGKTTKSADHLQAALKYLQLALHIFPKDKTLWFNLAIVLQDHTVVLSSERMDKISVGQMREAVRLADLAIRNLTWLASTPSDQYDQHIASQRVSYTRSVKEKLEKRIDELIETQEDRQKRLSEMIQQKQLEEASIHQKKSMELAQKQKEMEHVLKTYQSMNEKIRDELKVWDALQLKAQRRVKDSDGFVVPESAEDNLEDDPSYYSRSVKPSSKYPKPMDETGDRVSDPFVSNVVDENTLTSPSHFTQFSDEIESTEFEQATKRRRLKKRDGQDFNSSSSFDLVMQSQPDVEQID